MPALKDVKRITVEIAPGVETEFVDRDRALAQITEWAERSMRFPVVVFGPEGFGKTVFLRQLAEAASEVSGVAEVKLTYLAVEAVEELIRRRK